MRCGLLEYPQGRYSGSLKTEHASVAAKGQQIETEASPIRYVAELIGADTDSERAIRWMIALMVLCAHFRRLREHDSVSIRAPVKGATLPCFVRCGEHAVVPACRLAFASALHCLKNRAYRLAGSDRGLG
jgi:hypothetical protein